MPRSITVVERRVGEELELQATQTLLEKCQERAGLDKLAIAGLQGSIEGYRMSAEQRENRIDELETALTGLCNAIGETQADAENWTMYGSPETLDAMVEAWRKAREVLDPS